MNFKRGYPKEKKDISWGTPKQIQMEERQTQSIPSGLWKKKYKCKRLKGDHKYGEWKQKIYIWNSKKESGTWERFCTGCGKSETWFAPWIINESGYIIGHDKNARPPITP